MFKHCEEAGETYLEHGWVALRISWFTGLGSLCCLIHAVLPCLFCKTGSTLLARALELAETRK